jgi:hypothetical protein
MSRANTAAAKTKRRRQRSAVRLTSYRPEDEELARAWPTTHQEAGGEGWDQWITDDWNHHWVVMRGDVPVGLAQAAGWH